jgi:hypothetical protein
VYKEGVNEAAYRCRCDEVTYHGWIGEKLHTSAGGFAGVPCRAKYDLSTGERPRGSSKLTLVRLRSYGCKFVLRLRMKTISTTIAAAAVAVAAASPPGPAQPNAHAACMALNLSMKVDMMHGCVIPPHQLAECSPVSFPMSVRVSHTLSNRQTMSIFVPCYVPRSCLLAFNACGAANLAISLLAAGE